MYGGRSCKDSVRSPKGTKQRRGAADLYAPGVDGRCLAKSVVSLFNFLSFIQNLPFSLVKGGKDLLQC